METTEPRRTFAGPSAYELQEWPYWVDRWSASTRAVETDLDRLRTSVEDLARALSDIRGQDRQKQTRRAVDGVDARLPDGDVGEAEEGRRFAGRVGRGEHQS
jgi:hypothetical protein